MENIQKLGLNNSAITTLDDTAAAALSPPTRLANYQQILKKAFAVSGTQEVVDKYGYDSEVAYQTVKQGQEIKRDLEFVLLSSNARVAGNSSTAREMAGISSYLTTNTVFNSGGAPAGADPSPADGTATRTDSGTQQAFTETMLQDALQLMWENGGNVEGSMGVFGAFNRRTASGFGSTTTQFNRMESGRLFTSVRFYESDWGAVQFTPDRFGRARDGFIFDPEFLELRELRPMFREELSKTGDSHKFHVLMETTVIVRNEKAHAGIFDLTVS